MQFQPQPAKRPWTLCPQSVIGVISPASCVASVELESGCAALRALTGCAVEFSSAALAQDGDFAGTAGQRADALRQMWQRDDVDVIVCARGGYGSNYLLPLLDFAALQESPKAFVGYSDNTTLLLALDRAGLVSFHGPMVAGDFASGCVEEASFMAALGGEALDYSFAPGAAVQALTEGEAEGPIIGGCLSLVAASLGTPWEIETDGKLLFLEDVNEKPFRIDRMLMQLLLAGKLRHVRGMIFGEMLGCMPVTAEEESVPQLVSRILGGLNIPIVFGFPSGHVQHRNHTLPFGVAAQLQSSANGIRLHVEPATIASKGINRIHESS